MKLDAKPGILSSCGCLYCQNCTKKLVEKSIYNCPTCKSIINFKNFKNLRDKNELSKIMYLFENQDANIKKIQQSIKFQKKNRIQYIEFLEKRLKSLIAENKNLKKYSAMVNNNNKINKENISNNLNNSFNNNINNNNISRNIMSNKNHHFYLNNNKQNSYINNSNTSYSTEGNNNIYKTPNFTDRKSYLKKI